MREVKPNVFVEDRFSSPPGEYHGCNYGFVTTSDGIVLIDTPEWPSDAVSLRDELSQRGDLRFIINTHEHIDHVAGNHFLSGPVVAHASVKEKLSTPPGIEQAKQLVGFLFDERTAKRKREKLERVTSDELTWGYFLRVLLEDKDSEEVSVLDDYRMKEPDITFSDELTLYVGKHTFELTYLPGHSDSHLGVYVPEADVFFAGDNVASGVYPSLATSFPHEWIESLTEIEAHEVDVVVPGHGGVCGLEEVRDFKLFLDGCLAKVEDAVSSGMSREAAVDRISLDDGREALHSNEKAKEMDVTQLYEQLS